MQGSQWKRPRVRERADLIAEGRAVRRNVALRRDGGVLDEGNITRTVAVVFVCVLYVCEGVCVCVFVCVWALCVCTCVSG